MPYVDHTYVISQTGPKPLDHMILPWLQCDDREGFGSTQIIVLLLFTHSRQSQEAVVS